MQALNRLMKIVSICAIALVGLSHGNQSDSVQANVPKLSASLEQSQAAHITQALSADDMADRVEDALEKYPTLKPFDLDADDEGNAIVIKGTVRTAAQKALAEDIARKVAPGFTIINRITIR